MSSIDRVIIVCVLYMCNLDLVLSLFLLLHCYHAAILRSVRLKCFVIEVKKKTVQCRPIVQESSIYLHSKNSRISLSKNQRVCQA